MRQDLFELVLLLSKNLKNRSQTVKSITRILMVFCIFVALGCSEDMNTEDEMEVETVVEMETDTDVVTEMDVEEEPSAQDICKVGDRLMPGDSCIDPGTGDTFSVLDDGRGQYLFFTVGQSINMHGNINGKERSFVAERKEDDTWEIKEVTPE